MYRSRLRCDDDNVDDTFNRIPLKYVGIRTLHRRLQIFSSLERMIRMTLLLYFIGNNMTNNYFSND